MYYLSKQSKYQYKQIIDYAVDTSDYFMLVYCGYNKPLKKNTKSIKDALKPYLVKTRHNSVWPGTNSYSDKKYRFDICFYQSVCEVKSILQQAESIFDWEYPKYPEDLCFFRKNRCWLFSTPHEEIAGVICETVEDETYFKVIGVICSEDHVANNMWQYIEDGLE